MQKKPLILWGATGQAKMLNDCLQHSNLKLIALFDRNSNLASPFADIPIFHIKSKFFYWLNQVHPNQEISFLVAIGGDKGEERLQIQEFLKKEGLLPATALHSTAYIASGVGVGDGSQILPMACVNVGSAIGSATIINTGAVIEHECIIGDGVHIAPRACLAGCVTVENFATIYTGAIVAPRLRIGRGSIVAAGSVVLDDVPEYTLVAGAPAKKLRNLEIPSKQLLSQIELA